MRCQRGKVVTASVREHVDCDDESVVARKSQVCPNHDPTGLGQVADLDRVCEALKELCDRATTLVSISDADLALLAEGQRFAVCPRLALLFYHCCSNDPRAYIFNDECLLDDEQETTQQRLDECLD